MSLQYFDVTITRDTVYRVMAEDREAATDAALEDEGREVGGETTGTRVEATTAAELTPQELDALADAEAKRERDQEDDDDAKVHD